MAFLIAALLVSVGVGLAIGASRGQPHLGALLGILGPIGWIVAALLPLSYEKQLQREITHRQVMQAADAAQGKSPAPGGLQRLADWQVQDMSRAEKRAYTMHGTVPLRFHKKTTSV